MADNETNLADFYAEAVKLWHPKSPLKRAAMLRRVAAASLLFKSDLPVPKLKPGQSFFVPRRDIRPLHIETFAELLNILSEMAGDVRRFETRLIYDGKRRTGVRLWRLR